MIDEELSDTAASLGRRLTIVELPEATDSVQHIVRRQRLSSKQSTDQGTKALK